MEIGPAPRSRMAVVGDSQVGDHWRNIDESGLLPELELARCSIDGATASGTVNGAMAVFHADVDSVGFEQIQAFLEGRPGLDAVCVVLGSVDCHIWAWNECARTGEPATSILSRADRRLLDWCAAVVTRYVPADAVLVCGAVMPPLKDENRPRVRHVRMRNVRASQLELTRVSIAFNERLRAGALARGFRYLDITRETYDPDTHLVRDAFCGDDPLEHHLSTPATRELWVDRIRRVRAGQRCAT